MEPPSLVARPALAPAGFWDQAYEALKTKDPTLVDKYEKLLTRELSGQTTQVQLRSQDTTGQIPNKISAEGRRAQMDRIIKIGLERFKQVHTYHLAGHDFQMRDQIANAAKLVLWAKDWIDDAIQASPQASLAWAAVCMGLPLLTKPAAADKDNREGFAYVTGRMRYYIELEAVLLPQGQNVKSSTALENGIPAELRKQIEEHLVELYQAILDFQIKSVLRFYRQAFKNFFREIAQNEWKTMLSDVKNLEKILSDEIQQISTLATRSRLEELVNNAETFSSTVKDLLVIAERQLQVAEEERDLVAEQVSLGKQQLHIQRGISRCMTSSEDNCHQVFRLSQDGNSESYESYKDRIDERVEGTCEWFLSHPSYKSWKEESSGPLLVSADPGCGKSVLAKYLVNHEITGTKCYFFFRDQVQNTLKQALCAILHQLFKQEPSLIRHAMPQYAENGQKLVEVTPQLWGILHAVLNDVDRKPITIVLDALDECSESDLRELVRKLTNIFPCEADGPVKVKILLTSRPYQDIISEFHDLVELFPNVHIPGEEHSEQISKEVNCMIRSRVTKLARKIGLKDDLESHLQQLLLARPNRTYLWVYLVFESLEDKRIRFKKTKKGIEERVATLPENVYDAYEQILERSTDKEMARKVLAIILGAYRPLTLDEMNVAVNIQLSPRSRCFESLDLEDDSDFQKSLRDSCGLFVSVYQGKVQFLHQTAREFPVPDLSFRSTVSSPKIYSWRGSISICNAHSLLAKICLSYVNLENFAGSVSETTSPTPSSQSCSSSSSGDGSGSDLDHTDTDSLANNYFYDYSCNWPYHFRRAKNSIDSETLSLATISCDPTLRTIHDCIESVSHNAIYSSTYIFPQSDPLMIASALLIGNLVQHLVQSGNLHHRAKRGHTALHFAAMMSEPEVFMERSVDNAGARLSELYQAEQTNIDQDLVQSTKDSISRCLLDAGAEVDALDDRGGTPLHFAIYHNHESLVQLLVDRGANIDKVDEYQETALWKAVCSASLEIVQFLLDRGASMDTVDSEGNTMLHNAVGLRRTFKVMQLLIDRGASVNAVNSKGETALHKAAIFGRLEGVQLLLQCGAAVDMVDNSGKTACYRAVDAVRKAAIVSSDSIVPRRRRKRDQKRYPKKIQEELEADRELQQVSIRIIQLENIDLKKVIKVLLEHGAKANAICEGESMLHVALQKGDQELVELLRAYSEVPLEESSTRTSS